MLSIQLQIVHLLYCCIGIDIDIEVYAHSYNYTVSNAPYCKCLLNKETICKVTAYLSIDFMFYIVIVFL